MSSHSRPVVHEAFVTEFPYYQSETNIKHWNLLTEHARSDILLCTLLLLPCVYTSRKLKTIPIATQLLLKQRHLTLKLQAAYLHINWTLVCWRHLMTCTRLICCLLACFLTLICCERWSLSIELSQQPFYHQTPFGICRIALQQICLPSSWLSLGFLK